MENQIKRGRGRPKGSKNKSKNPVSQSTRQGQVAIKNDVTRIPKEKNPIAVDPNWIPTKTMYGTPIWLKAKIVIRDSDIAFLAVVHPDTRPYVTQVSSKGIFKPSFTPEQEKEYEGVEFYVPPPSVKEATVEAPVVEQPVKEDKKNEN